MRTWAHVAELIKPKTLQGGLVVRSADGLPFSGRVKGTTPSTRFCLREGMEVVFVPPQIDAPRSGRVESIQQIKDDSYLVYFDSVTDIDTAEALVGCFCLVKRSDLPEDFDVLEESDWIGFEVNDANLSFLGNISEVIENPGQSLLVVQGERGEILIPLVDEFIKHIDETRKVISTEIPSGLLDLAVERESGKDED